MSKKIVTLCDPHLWEHDQEVDGDTYRLGVQMPGARWAWVEIDLCESDAEEVARFAAYLEKYGREFSGPEQNGTGKRKYTRRTPAPEDGQEGATGPANGLVGKSFTCPACGTTVSSASGYRDHARRVHERSVDQLDGRPTPFACDHCSMAFAKPQALAIHTSRVHAGD
jgi:hypothetical protein